MKDEFKHILLPTNATNTTSLQRSPYTVADNTFSQKKTLPNKNNNEFEEVIDDTSIDTTTFNDKIVFPIPNVINKIDRYISNKKDCRIVQSTPMSSTS